MPILVQYENNFDDLYFEATKDMTSARLDAFVYYLLGAVQPYLSPEAAAHVIAVAQTLEDVANGASLAEQIKAVSARIEERQQEPSSLHLVKR